MTKEKVIDYPQSLDLDKIIQVPIPLDKTEATDEQTDLFVSLKMVDKDDNNLLLLEALPCTLEDEFDKCIVGCFIKRFEFVEQFLKLPYNSILEKFLNSFIIRVKYNTHVLLPNGYTTEYQYLLAKTEVGKECLIAKRLGMNKFKNDGYVFYKKDIQR